ncbi:MAG TPA: lamin tail domain-containing protein, partial [Candidatus Binatia bacterium]|nr:lamin tail domain-containing protein [Candidatus Binatia bacterium]
MQFEDIDITPGLGLLRNGLNVLAIQGLNASATDIDFLISAELRGATLSLSTNAPRYFTIPTPGAPNGFGNTNLGPLVFELTHTPNEPLDNEDLVVTARTRMTFNPVDRMTLTYRIMYSNEVTIPMFDDGAHGDGPAGDGMYGASIPAGVSVPGDMVRYYVRSYDTLSNVTRFPTFVAPATNNVPQYYGTIVHNPLLTNPLPVLHLFIPNNILSNNVNNDSVGSYPASIYYLGEFYDNMHLNRHGQSSSDFPRRSYDLDFNPGYNFRYDPNEERVDDINLLSTYPDKAKMRNMLSYQIYKDAGSAYHFVYPVRVQLNGAYYCDYHFVENGDENYTKRLGWDPRGALYKMYNTFDSPALGVNANAEKKTRKWEGNEDLVALWNGCVTGTNYLFDNVNIPETINFLASRILTGDVDCCHKNYYLYRDSEGTGEWAGTPWDVDLSFGRNWNGTSTYYDDTIYPNNGLNVGGNNRLFGLFFSTPSLNQMYLRRIRTLMDELLQPTNTPPEQLKLEAQVNYWRDLIAPDAELEKTAWVTWGGTASTPAGNARISTCCTQSVAMAAGIINSNYLPQRRVSMYGRAPGTIPNAQPSNAVVLIGAIEYSPANANQAQEYVQLRNTNNYAVDMSFWSITGAISYTFRGGVVMPANSQMFLSPDVRQFRARTTGPRGTQGNFVQGNYKGQLSARGESLYLTDRGGRAVFATNYPGNPSLPQQYLRITEIMYHPTQPPAGSLYTQEDFEYIELRNIGPVSIILNGVHFVEGIEFAFTNSVATTLGAGGRMLLVKNLAAFTSRYGTGFNIGGVYTGTLDNGGEGIRLDDAVNEKILEFRYENNWYPSTDGMGFSLVIIDDTAPYYTWNSKVSWRPSGADGGTPGGGDQAPPTVATILVNEVYTHSDPAPPYDFIELYNPNTNAVNIGGWFISDDFTTPKKFRIPAGRTIPAGGYAVFDETDYNADPNSPLSFSFSSKGDEAYVFSGDGTNLTGFFHGYEFGAAENGVSFGRYYTSTGGVHFVAQSARTPGATNALPKVGPIVISEIMYHPPDRPGGADDQEMEFIELYNVTSNAVPLFENGNSWRIRGGVDYDFPSTTSIPAGGYALVVAFHPLDPPRAAAFRARYNLAASVPLYGPYAGKLDNSHDQITLQRPDAPDGNDIPHIVVDEVEYADVPPWPQIADGIGPSLQRLRVSEYGNDAINWTAVVPSPNAPYAGGAPPAILTQPTDQTGVASFDATFT